MSDKLPLTTGYAASRITLLDRATHETKVMYCYPITEIVLVRLDATDQMTWRVGEDGNWGLVKPEGGGTRGVC